MLEPKWLRIVPYYSTPHCEVPVQHYRIVLFEPHGVNCMPVESPVRGAAGSGAVDALAKDGTGAGATMVLVVAASEDCFRNKDAMQPACFGSCFTTGVGSAAAGFLLAGILDHSRRK